MHRVAYQVLGLPHFYDAIDCPDLASLQTVTSSLRRGLLAGINVTLPYKKHVLSLVDTIDPSASEIGAANTLVRTPQGTLVAYNTDVPALVDELRALQPKTATAVILGAGGAAAAALAACKVLGVRVVAITTRSWSSSQDLYENPVAEAFREQGALTVPWPQPTPGQVQSSMSGALRLQWHDLAASADIVIQATSAGLPRSGDEGHHVAMMVPWSRLPKTAVALDVVYAPAPTPFLKSAMQTGIRAVDGSGMLARQGALAIEHWLGVKPPLDPMVAAIHRFLSTHGQP